MKSQPSFVLPLFRRRSRLPAILLTVVVSAWQICQPLQAATYYWDTDGSDSGNLVDGTNVGGSGAWDTTASNWWPVPAGALTTWGNTSSDIAIFGGPLVSVPAAVTVSLASGITSNQVQFQRSGYTLSGKPDTRRNKRRAFSHFGGFCHH